MNYHKATAMSVDFFFLHLALNFFLAKTLFYLFKKYNLSHMLENFSHLPEVMYHVGT